MSKMKIYLQLFIFIYVFLKLGGGKHIKRITPIAVPGQLLNKRPVKTLFDRAKRQ